jgi:transcriptional regulator
MYIPAAFHETDTKTLHDFIEAHSFALLVSMREGVPFATHLPLLLQREAGPHGALIGHVARANPHWQELEGQESLAIFSGPHAYVSPGWYESDQVVPTWNYIAVHAYGRARLIEEPAEVAEVLSRMVALYEGSMPKPWSVDTGTDFFHKMARAVVCFRMEVTRLEGKWKLSQNQPRERQEKVARALAASSDRDSAEIGRLIARRLLGPTG